MGLIMEVHMKNMAFVYLYSIITNMYQLSQVMLYWHSKKQRRQDKTDIIEDTTMRYAIFNHVTVMA